MSQLKEHDPSISQKNRTIYFNSPTYYVGHNYASRPYLVIVDSSNKSYAKDQQKLENYEDICFISIEVFYRLAKKPKNETVVLQPEDFNREREREHLFGLDILDFVDTTRGKYVDLNLAIMSPNDLKKFFTTYRTDLKEKLPLAYYDILDTFYYKNDFTLKKHGLADYTINLKLGTALLYQKGYLISADKLVVVKKYLDDKLTKGTIEKSNL